ncbi:MULTISPECIES: helix-turn-helix domain-containing protein [Actinoplanes]|uniref:helix-turn-helix domain-containing protein n=1 Tax=Actinoplanes TaxID=1865 RepID=UPI0005F2FD42|nr:MULTISPECIES: helix-turn-helix domain-containing protein [Actinoplanes]GLY02675.1 AraC family transcriptional regulator [Actinoplanes sp. NBRC 101535]
MSGADAFLDELSRSGLPPLIGKRHAGDGFRAGIVVRDLGPLRLAELVTPEGECFRTARSARDADAGMWQLELVTRGYVRAEHSNGTAVLGPGDLMLLDPARPVSFATTDTTSVTMMVPRTTLRLAAADVDRLAGVRIRGDHGPAALVGALARDMARSVTGFRDDEAARSADAVIALIAVALAAPLRDVRPAPDDVLRNRITGFVEARLSDRGLCPAAVAAAHHISLRRLHRLFEGEPLTVAALIRRRRLERCRADLAAGHGVAAVAARWGFADPAHFSRLFTATYGYNPSTLTSGR